MLLAGSCVAQHCPGWLGTTQEAETQRVGALWQWAWAEADFGWFLPSVLHCRGSFGGKMVNVTGG